MSDKTTYYNEDYCPIEDQYREAEARDNPPDTGITETNRIRTRPKKRVSRYDQEMYALPDNEGDGSTPDVSGNGFASPNSSTNSRQVTMWRNIAISTTIIAILALGGLVSVMFYYNLPHLPGLRKT